jgi:hypothetical protein
VAVVAVAVPMVLSIVTVVGHRLPIHPFAVIPVDFYETFFISNVVADNQTRV